MAGVWYACSKERESHYNLLDIAGDKAPRKRGPNAAWTPELIVAAIKARGELDLALKCENEAGLRKRRVTWNPEWGMDKSHFWKNFSTEATKYRVVMRVVAKKVRFQGRV